MSALRSVLAALVAVLALSAQASTPTAGVPGDPPARAGRVADFDGQAWVFDQDQGQWIAALRNRALAEGDRVSTSGDARATLQIGSLRLWLGPRSEVELLQLDERGTQIQLHGGSVAVHVRTRESADSLSLFTREVRLRPLRAGLYRIDRLDDATFAATVRGDLLLEDATTMPIGPGTRVEFWRASNWVLQQRPATWPQDALQQQLAREESREERTAAQRYVSPELTGAEDLERYGRWERHPEYGMVWAPIGVSLSWAPFRDGRWVWLRAWGWTWVDAQPWGFATSHYGRWVPVGSRWVWVPGVYVGYPVFAPAVVAWIGGPTVSVGISLGGGPRPLPGSSWVPLPPGQPWRPWVPATPHYVERVNRGPWAPRRAHVPREPSARERLHWPESPGGRDSSRPPPQIQPPTTDVRPLPPPVRHGPRPGSRDDDGPGLPRFGAGSGGPPAAAGLPPAANPVPSGAGRPDDRLPEPAGGRPGMRGPSPTPTIVPGVPTQAPPAGAAPPPRPRGPAVRDPEAPDDRRARTPESRQGLRGERESTR